jgi:DNA helicase II / ATP-dependent DNA helicase PcrA
MIDTDEQRAIISLITGTDENLVVEALAGTGKTTTLLRSLERIPQKSVLLCAFNKRIADELAAKLPVMPRGHLVQVKTFHAQGLAMIKAHYPRMSVDGSATEDVIKRASSYAISFKVKRAACRLLRTVKETTITRNPPTSSEVLAMGYEYDLFDRKMNDREIALAVEVVRDGYTISLDLANRDVIDFCDMVWAPLACELEAKSRFKAVLVDELQDISAPQFAMLRKLIAPGGRFIGIGDINQQIYGWRGSMGQAAWSVARLDLKAKFLPLTMTWRCATSIVEAARALVPGLRGRPGAATGTIKDVAWTQLPKAIGKEQELTTFVLSRNNANLLECALYLWRSRVPFELNAGKEMLDPLFHLLDFELDLRSRPAFIKSLEAWHTKQITAAEKANAPSAADRADEEKGMLLAAVAHTDPTGIKKLLYDIITPNGSGVLLSTVHKVKGLEADRVFLLKQTFARHEERDESDAEPIDQEELNIEYVAITRARSELFWVDVNVREAVAGFDPMLTLGIKSEAQQLAEKQQEFLFSEDEP